MTYRPTGLYPVFVPDDTRQRILEAAFAEFYRNGFQGGSLNHIITTAGATKGGVFHHFTGKQALGYAVVDEIIAPLLRERWLKPIETSTNPLADLKRAFKRYVKEDIESGAWLQGCPLNNLAQEMSPLDEGFRLRIDALYKEWRECFSRALAAGKRAGKVSAKVSPEATAGLLVTAQMGIWGTGKYSQSSALMMQANDALCSYLDSLKGTI